MSPSFILVFLDSGTSTTVQIISADTSLGPREGSSDDVSSTKDLGALRCSYWNPLLAYLH